MNNDLFILMFKISFFDELVFFRKKLIRPILLFSYPFSYGTLLYRVLYMPCVEADH